MKRLHLHVKVNDLEQNIHFYSQLFGAEPEKVKDDYAKWMLDDPRINFAVSTRASQTGLDHFGIQVDDEQDLSNLRDHLKSTDINIDKEGETSCCYAKSDKTWVSDPNGIAWEIYQTMSDVELFTEDANNIQENSACCAAPPKAKTEKTSCCG